MSKKKNTTTPTPHDAAFRSFLANPDVARDFLELHLPAEYRQLCDLSTLKLEPATFVEPDLHQYASDICQRQDYWPFFAIFNVRYWSLMLSAFRHFIITDWRGVFCQHSRFAFFL